MEVIRPLAGLALLAAGCSIADFDVSQSVPEQRISGSPVPGPLAALFPIPINLDIDSKIKAMDTGPINSVTLSSLTLTITPTSQPSGDQDDWSFVSHIDVFIESTKSGSTLAKVKIASVSSPGAVQAMEFAVESSVNLKPYIDEGSQVDSTGSGNAPSDDVSYNGTGVFTVHPL